MFKPFCSIIFTVSMCIQIGNLLRPKISMSRRNKKFNQKATFMYPAIWKIIGIHLVQPGGREVWGELSCSLQLPDTRLQTRGSSGCCPKKQAIRQNEIAPSSTRRGLYWIIGIISSPKMLSGIGTGCPGKQLGHHPQRCFRHVNVTLGDIVGLAILG